MFALELPNDEAQKLIWAWEDRGILSPEYDLVQQDGYVHINWLYGLFHYDRPTFDLIHNILRVFLANTPAPHIFESQEFISSIQIYGDNYEIRHIRTQDPFDLYEFRWPQQLERYRVALLLKATE